MNFVLPKLIVLFIQNPSSVNHLNQSVVPVSTTAGVIVTQVKTFCQAFFAKLSSCNAETEVLVEPINAPVNAPWQSEPAVTIK